jgi:hypothetical protein
LLEEGTYNQVVVFTEKNLGDGEPKIELPISLMDVPEYA